MNSVQNGQLDFLVLERDIIEITGSQNAIYPAWLVPREYGLSLVHIIYPRISSASPNILLTRLLTTYPDYHFFLYFYYF